MLKHRKSEKLGLREDEEVEVETSTAPNPLYDDPLIPSDINLAPEGVFGLLDDMLDDLTATRKANAKSKKKESPFPKPEIKEQPMQDIPVNLSDIPPEFDRLNYGNVVNVSAADLKDTSKEITRRTSAFSEKLLQHLLPLLLSYSSSTNYTQAVLREGLKLDIDFDPGLEEAIKHIGYLGVIHHFVRNSKLPKSTKRVYLDKLAEALSAKTVERVFAVNTSASKMKEINRLAAVVRSRQGNTDPNAEQKSVETSSALGSRRSRKVGRM